ncbi:hypothetical protein, partial [Sphingopyxis sp.]|uniref:hypothetical protein n=1 Tax=Sphingopyxis sp. TaxID=1908224 RepID=UPI0035AE78FD
MVIAGGIFGFFAGVNAEAAGRSGCVGFRPEADLSLIVIPDLIRDDECLEMIDRKGTSQSYTPVRVERSRDTLGKRQPSRVSTSLDTNG